MTTGARGSVMEWSTLFRPALLRPGTHSTGIIIIYNVYNSDRELSHFIGLVEYHIMHTQRVKYLEK